MVLLDLIPGHTHTHTHVYRDHSLISIVYVTCIAGQRYLEIPTICIIPVCVLSNTYMSIIEAIFTNRTAITYHLYDKVPTCTN